MFRAHGVPAEFEFITACCRWPHSDARDVAIKRALAAPIDWDAVLRIVKRQRVAGLVRDGLARSDVPCPTTVTAELECIVADMVRQNLKQAAESVRIQRLFDGAGVPLLFMKGVTLTQLAYGNLALKHSRDIDILVAPDTVPIALELLSQAGYHPFPALPADKHFKHWLKFTRECLLFDRSNSVLVELHWRLTDNDYFLSGLGIGSQTRTIGFANGAELRTLLDDDLFIYLCVHGAYHTWSRLKWLADVAALLAHDSARDARRRLEAASKVNAEDCMAQAYLLCDRLFETSCVTELAQSLRAKRRYRWLEQLALSAMTTGGAGTEQGNTPFDRLPGMLSHFMLGRGWRFAVRELWIKLNGPFDWQDIPLPDGLGFLYPLFRVAAFVKRGGRLRPWPLPPNGVVD